MISTRPCVDEALMFSTSRSLSSSISRIGGLSI
jgi:hypothetical protein